MDKIEQKLRVHDIYKEETFSQIDEFFDIIVKKALERKETLKEQYLQTE